MSPSTPVAAPTWPPVGPTGIAPGAADLAERVRQLSATASIEYWKLGTEEEGLDFSEIAFVAETLSDGLPVFVKIGGPCARADMRQAAGVGARGLLAPMIESAFALRRFVEGSEDVLGAAAFAPGPGYVRRGINLETGTAYAVLDALLAEPAAARLDFFNVGRSDLASSLGVRVESAHMTDVVRDIGRRVRATGRPIFVGGAVTSATLAPLFAVQAIDGFQTRFLAFRCEGVRHVDETVRLALEVEVALLHVLAERFPARADEHLRRAHVVAGRLAV